MALRLAAAALILAYLIGRPTMTTSQPNKPRGPCQQKYCYGEMWVDKAMNTELKDQSLGVGLGRPQKLPGLQSAEKKLYEDYYEDAIRNPGVKLVAHAVV